MCSVRTESLTGVATSNSTEVSDGLLRMTAAKESALFGREEIQLKSKVCELGSVQHCGRTPFLKCTMPLCCIVFCSAEAAAEKKWWHF